MSKIIEKIEYFSAGSCSSHLHHMFKGLPKQELAFPAGVFLLKHRDKGYILYDTGYDPNIQKARLKYFLYGLATPVSMSEDERIDRLLRQRGIEPEEISYVLLSHLHPDHIGGASYFPQASFILTQEAFETYSRSRLRDLVFKEFLPADFEDRLRVVKAEAVHPVFPYRETLDLFGDGSIYLASVGGHAAGQACLFLPEHDLFIAADLAWGIDLLPYTQQMRLLPSLIQADKKEYLAGIALIEQVQAAGYRVLVSHDPKERAEGIVNASMDIS